MSSRLIVRSVGKISSRRLSELLLKSNVAAAIVPGRFYSDESVVEKFAPGIRSPFDNPRRVHKASYPTDKLEKDAKVEKVKPDTLKSEPIQKEELGSTVLAEEVAKKIEDINKAAETLKSDAQEPVQAQPAGVQTASTSFGSSILSRLGIERIPDDIPEDEKKKQKTARNTRLGILCLTFGTFCGLVWFCFHYGRARRDEAGNVIVDAYSTSVLAPFYRIADGFRDWMNYAVEPSREKLLPDPLKPPYIQPKYTLVIEMKNVLVAPEWTYKTGYRFKKRPALDYFLDVVGYPNFELVIYTSEPPMSAFSVVDSIDPKQRIMYRLFRDCTKYQDGHHIKDLGRLNRDLSKVIFIDFDAQSAKLNPENVLRLPKWDGDMDDTALVDLAELLKTIHLSDTDDVRPTLQYYSSFDNPPAEFRRRAIELAEWEKQKQQQKNESSLKKYGGFFGFRRHQNV
uniref:Mitochondrial import inner membrane translocase subunit TIM50 n=1 Tax=Bursaphelenchus xylophilus TaxID=6326 RepID=A0A1I7RSL1_BURXY